MNLRRHRATVPGAIDKAVPGELDVHLVCDNLATHKTPAIRDWLDEFVMPDPVWDVALGACGMLAVAFGSDVAAFDKSASSRLL
jgi:NADH:ubiquinone oxidoreductase subunit B-like Fe-S oxidoreductase